MFLAAMDCKYIIQNTVQISKHDRRQTIADT